MYKKIICVAFFSAILFSCLTPNQENAVNNRIKYIEYKDHDNSKYKLTFIYENDKIIKIMNNDEIVNIFEYKNNELSMIRNFTTETYLEINNIKFDGTKTTWNSELYFLNEKNIYKHKNNSGDQIINYLLKTKEIDTERPIYWEYWNFNTNLKRHLITLKYKNINSKEFSDYNIIINNNNSYSIYNAKKLLEVISITYEKGMSNIDYTIQK